MNSRIKRQRANSLVQALMLVVSLSVLASFGALGNAARSAITGAQTAAHVSQSPGLASRAQAAIGTVIRNLSNAGRTLFSQALDSARMGDVFGVQQARAALLGSVPDSVFEASEFRNALDANLRRAFASSDRRVRTLDEGYLGAARRALESDPDTARRLQQVRDDADRLLDNIVPRDREFTEAEQVQLEALRDARRAWVPYFIYEDTRAIMLRAIDDDARAFSDDFWSKSADLEPEGRTVDVLTIGAGLSGAQASSTIAAFGEGVSRLVVEASDSASSANFRAGGDVFAYNMTNRQFRFKGPEGPGKTSNLAPIDGPVNPSDLSGLKYAPARNWAEAAAAALRASEADVVVGTKVIDVVQDTSADAPGYWKVTLQRGNETRTVWANTVLDGVGAGRPKVIGDAETKALIREEFGKVDFEDPSKAPVVITARDYLTMSALHPEWRDKALADSSGLRDLVVGIGDSAFTTLESRLGLAFEGPTRASAQRGLFAGVDFAVGEQGPRTAREFLLGRSEGTWPGSRTRYVDIYTAVKKAQDAILESAQGRLATRDVTALETGGNLSNDALGALSADVSPGLETIRLRATRVEKIERVSAPPVDDVDGAVKVTFSDGRSEVYRRVILATGYESPSKDWLRGEYPDDITGSLQESGRLDVIDAEGRVIPESQLGETEAAVARQIPDKPYYFIGLNAGGDLIPSSQLDGVAENNAAFFNWSPRIRDLVKGLIARGEVSTSAGLDESIARSPRDRVEEFKVDARFKGAFANRDGLNAVQRATFGGSERLALRTEVEKLLSTLVLDVDRIIAGEGGVELRFYRSNATGDSLQWSTNLMELPTSWRQRLIENDLLPGLIDRQLGRGEEFVVRARFRTEPDEDLFNLPRTIRPDSIRITRE